MPGFSQALNTDVNGKLASSVYDTNISQWLQHTGNCLQTAGGLWVFQKGDAGGNAVIVGAAADNTAAAGNPVQMGGRYNAADPALDDGDIGFIRVNSKGEPLVELTGSIVTEILTQEDAVADVLTFSDDIYAIEIYHDETTPQEFVVNGLTLRIASGGWRSLIGGTPGDTVEIPTGIDCIVTRLV